MRDVVEPEWDRAACVGHDPETFQSDTEIGRALQICGTCPILDDCRRWAIANRPPVMVWGGLVPRHSEKTYPICGTLKGLKTHLDQGEPLDNYCRAVRDGTCGSERGPQRRPGLQPRRDESPPRWGGPARMLYAP